MTVQQEAYGLIDQLSDDGVSAVVQIMIRMINPVKPKTTPVKRGGIRIGLAKGKFQLNDDAFDKMDTEIADMFEGAVK